MVKSHIWELQLVSASIGELLGGQRGGTAHRLLITSSNLLPATRKTWQLFTFNKVAPGAPTAPGWGEGPLPPTHPPLHQGDCSALAFCSPAETETHFYLPPCQPELLGQAQPFGRTSPSPPFSHFLPRRSSQLLASLSDR